jgi:hypothetical protein
MTAARVKILHCPPYKNDVLAVVGAVPARWLREQLTALDVHGGADLIAVDHCEARLWFANNAPVFMWLRSLDSVPVIAHETLHVAAGVLRNRGVTLSAESEEAFTYLQEYICAQLCDADGWDQVNDSDEAGYTSARPGVADPTVLAAVIEPRSYQWALDQNAQHAANLVAILAAQQEP